MHNFKVGDVVERVDYNRDYSGLPSGKQGIISEVRGNVVRIKGYGSWWHLAKTLRAVVVEQDDTLPPAPESVLYIGLQQHVHRRLQVKVFTPANGGSVVDLHIGGDMLGDGKSCTLDPDAALQLAHDLRRMAMEIKRKEKQNG